MIHLNSSHVFETLDPLQAGHNPIDLIIDRIGSQDQFRVDRNVVSAILNLARWLFNIAYRMTFQLIHMIVGVDQEFVYLQQVFVDLFHVFILLISVSVFRSFEEIPKPST